MLFLYEVVEECFWHAVLLFLNLEALTEYKFICRGHLYYVKMVTMKARFSYKNRILFYHQQSANKPRQLSSCFNSCYVQALWTVLPSNLLLSSP